MERVDLFDRIRKSLKPGGLLVIQGYGKNQLCFKTGGPGKVEHLYDECCFTTPLRAMKFKCARPSGFRCDQTMTEIRHLVFQCCNATSRVPERP